MKKSVDLAHEMAKVIHAGEDITIDDFLDRFNVPNEDRNDFAVAAIVRQALAYEKEM